MMRTPYESAAAPTSHSAADPAKFNAVCRSKSNLPNRTDTNAALLPYLTHQLGSAQLKRARVTSQDLVAFYCACVRSSLDYACAVFHFSLPQYLQTELERIQKRALFTIYPGLSYAEALVEAGIPV